MESDRDAYKEDKFADDVVFIAETTRELQTIVDRVYKSSNDYGLGFKINIAKTEVKARKSVTSAFTRPCRLKQVYSLQVDSQGV